MTSALIPNQYSCIPPGGPLELGDIEDLDGYPTVFCPWHNYDFNLKTGESSTGLQQQTYEVQVVGSEVYINIDVELSRKPNSDQASDETNIRKTELSPDAIAPRPSSDTLCNWAVTILCTPDPEKKVRLTLEVADRWITGDLSDIGECTPPDEPVHTKDLKVVAVGKTRKLGKAGSLGSRVSLLHSLANIEQWAIDLSWDIIARFSRSCVDGERPLPKEFFTDFVKVAADEAKHYKLLAERLLSLGSFFGSQPVHNGLWQSAQETSHSLLSRLAIVHMVHEARGLDVHPKTHARFLSAGDKESADLLEVLYTEEITHVATGIQWFSFICDSITTFHELVRKHFKGYLKPPFDTSGREQAGMTEAWYLPLVKPS
ncbi:predicted protein [Nematostella vectensis]|uniref:Rieske domain-containing protein n=1 Tax=Nematostella vectensis TaxID=45351 RepID=A7RFG6_NEMVE|nr:predicted protein [Nematostella vectensis]|eukprot:XP_001641779.1 predicted protein [Nematostella vectensis]